MTCRNTILSAFAFAMGLGVAQAQGDIVSSATAVSMTCDKNRKIHAITYNVLNLPSKVTFNDGHIIQYTYDADGRKLKMEYLLSGMHFLDLDVKKVSPAALGEVIERPSLIVKPVTQAKVQYCANHVYRNGALERVDNGYGYWADSTYHYNITDYQGNIRAVLAADGTLEEMNNYYPYGALMAAGGSNHTNMAARKSSERTASTGTTAVPAGTTPSQAAHQRSTPKPTTTPASAPTSGAPAIR